MSSIEIGNDRALIPGEPKLTSAVTIEIDIDSAQPHIALSIIMIHS